MINNYPLFGFPNYLNRNNNMLHLQQPDYNYYKSSASFGAKKDIKGHSFTNNSNSSDPKHSKEDTLQVPFIQLFGISLYFDDILLICVILFLYNERIDDYYLILVLILLLLG